MKFFNQNESILIQQDTNEFYWNLVRDKGFGKRKASLLFIFSPDSNSIYEIDTYRNLISQGKLEDFVRKTFSKN